MIHRTSLVLAVAAVLGLGAVPAHATHATTAPPVTPIQLEPKAAVDVSGLNRSGTVVVGQWDGPTMWHGARWDARGKFTDLGFVGDEDGTWAMGANDRGVIYGESMSGGLYGLAPRSMEWRTRVVRWDRAGHLTKLGWLPGGTDAEARGISSDGTIVGRANDAPGSFIDRVVLWDTHNRIVALPQRDYYTYPVAIADDHSVIGNSVTENGVSTAVRWDSHHRLRVLRTPAGWTSTARAANRYGVAVGTIGNSTGGQRLVRWDSTGRMTILRVPTTATGSAVIVGINAHGTAFGWISRADGTPHAAIWDRHGRITVVHLPDGASSKPVAMNDHGVMAGWVSTPTRGYPAVWDTRGRVRELSTPYLAAVDPPPTDITVIGIADNGVVAGRYRLHDQVNVLWRTNVR